MKVLMYVLLLIIGTSAAYAAGTICFTLQGGNVCINTTRMTGTKIDWSDILNLQYLNGNDTDVYFNKLETDNDTYFDGNVYLTKTACGTGKTLTTNSVTGLVSCTAIQVNGTNVLLNKLLLGSAYPNGIELNANGDAWFGNDTWIEGDLYLGGSILSVVSQNVTGNVYPSANLTYNIGTPAKYWNYGYFGNIITNSINASVYYGDGSKLTGITSGGSFSNNSDIVAHRLLLNTTETRPSCAAGNRGEFYSNQSTTGDTLWWCAMDSGLNYNWIMVART